MPTEVAIFVVVMGVAFGLPMAILFWCDALMELRKYRRSQPARGHTDIQPSKPEQNRQRQD